MDWRKVVAFARLAVLIIGLRLGIRAVREQSRDPEKGPTRPPRWYLVVSLVLVGGVGTVFAFGHRF